MRGKGLCPRSRSHASGITPAYAGKSGSLGHPAKSGEDHPRLCGEKAWFAAFQACFLGSPPPMRGKAVLIRLYRLRIRITPAYAGKSKNECV